MLSIVRVTAENYSKFLSLYSEYISEDTDTGNSIIEVKEWEAMKQDGMFTMEYFSSYRLLQIGSQVKGFVQVRQMFPHRRRLLHQYMVGPLYINPSVRRRGYARHLLKACLEEVRRESSEPVVYISLLVNEKNIPAQKLYRSLGFSVTGTLPAYLHVGEDYHSVISLVLVLEKK